MQVNNKELKDFLNEKADQYERPAFIKEDPIQVPHAFSKKGKPTVPCIASVTNLFTCQIDYFFLLEKYKDLVGFSTTDGMSQINLTSSNGQVRRVELGLADRRSMH